MPGTSDTLSEMPAEDLTTAVIELPFHHRVRLGVRKGQNWLQLVRFGAVGASGYAVNLISFAILRAPARRHLLGRVADRVPARDGEQLLLEPALDLQPRPRGPSGHQAWKFFAVSLLSFGVNYAVLITLVKTTGMEQVLAQAIANAVGMPVNFLGQKLWSFKL